MHILVEIPQLVGGKEGKRKKIRSINPHMFSFFHSHFGLTTALIATASRLPAAKHQKSKHNRKSKHKQPYDYAAPAYKTLVGAYEIMREIICTAQLKHTVLGIIRAKGKNKAGTSAGIVAVIAKLLAKFGKHIRPNHTVLKSPMSHIDKICHILLPPLRPPLVILREYVSGARIKIRAFVQIRQKFGKTGHSERMVAP